MVPIQLINSVLEWERALEYEEERRRNHRYEPYVNYLAAPQPRRKENKSILQIFQHRQESRPVYRCCQEPCQETQPC